MRIPRPAWPRRPDPRLAMLLLALACGALAAWLGQRHIAGRVAQIEARASVETAAVLVAAEDMAAGARVEAERVAVRDVPLSWVPAGALRPEHFADIDGERLAFAVARGEPIQRMHMAVPRAPALSARLAPGMRAITLPVDESGSVSGLVQPGDRIDLYLSFEHQRRRVTAPLLADMRVLATGRRTEAADGDDPDQGGYTTVTLEATPQQAMKLIAARDAGPVTAMLRRPGDAGPPARASREALPALLGLAEPRRPAVQGGAPILYGDRPLRRIPKLAEPDEGEPAGDIGEEDAP